MKIYLSKRYAAHTLSVLMIMSVICFGIAVMKATPVNAEELGCPDIDSYSTEGSSVTLYWSQLNYGLDTSVEIICVTTNKKYPAPESRGYYKISNLPAGETVKIKWRVCDNDPTKYVVTDWSGPLYITIAEGSDEKYKANENTDIVDCQIWINTDHFTYDGKSKSITITVTDGPDKTLTEGIDYKVTGNSRVNTGEQIITVTGMGDYTGSKRVSFVIFKADPVLYYENSTITIKKGEYFSNTLHYTSGLTIIRSSSNTSVAKITADNKINIVGTGTTTITASFEGSGNYNSKSASFRLIVNPAENQSKLDTDLYINYYGNGGTGIPGTQLKKKGQTIYISSTVPARSGYKFQGWSTGSSSTTVAYKPGDAYTKDSNLNLYAVWKKNDTVTSYKKILKFKQVALPFDNLYGDAGKANETICRIVYKKKDAKRFLKSEYNTGNKGNCFGMVSTAGLLYSAGEKKQKNKKPDISYQWNGKGKYIKIRDQVRALHTAYISDQNKSAWYSRTAAELADAVKKDLSGNHITIVSMYNNKYEHSVAVIGFETVNSSYDRLTIYDPYSWNSDANKKAQYLYLYKNGNGSYTGLWKYTVNGKNKFYHKKLNDNVLMSYETYSQYSGLWSKRGSLTFSS